MTTKKEEPTTRAKKRVEALFNVAGIGPVHVHGSDSSTLHDAVDTLRRAILDR